MKTATPILLLAAVLLATASAPAAELKTSVPARGKLAEANFELWIPDAIPPAAAVRGIVAFPDYHDGRNIYTRKEWREFAESHGFALLRHQLLAVKGDTNKLDHTRDGTDALLEAVKDLAKKSGRPELEHAAFVHTGLSQGGWQASRYSGLIPERTIAAVCFHGGAESGKGVPALFLSAENDTFAECAAPATTKLMERLRASRLPVAHLLQPSTPHHEISDQSYVMVWLDEVVGLRLPKPVLDGRRYIAPPPLAPVNVPAGWICTYTVGDAPKQKPFQGGKFLESPKTRPMAEAGAPDLGWLPSRRLAKAWLCYSQTGETGPLEPKAVKP